MGDPWAGQDKLKLSDLAWEYRIPSVLMENFGFDPPMGSTNTTLCEWLLTEMLEWVIPELDRIDWGFQIVHEKFQQQLQYWWKIWVSILQLALQISFSNWLLTEMLEWVTPELDRKD